MQKDAPGAKRGKMHVSNLTICFDLTLDWSKKKGCSFEWLEHAARFLDQSENSPVKKPKQTIATVAGQSKTRLKTMAQLVRNRYCALENH